MHLTVAMFGDTEFFEKFGKKGTENDLLIRNQVDSGHVITYVTPNSEKIQPVVQAADMGDVQVVVVNEVNQEIGEIIILLSEMKAEKGIFVTDFHDHQIKEMIKGTSLESFDFCKKDENQVREILLETKIERKKEPVLVTADNYFPVKGVGTVVLGLVKSGTVKQYDKLVVYPLKQEVLVKSMQSQDRDVKETEPGQRIGLAIKGVDTEKMKRGFVFSDQEIECSSELELNIQKSKFSKFEINEGKKILVVSGQQVVSAAIEHIDKKVKLKLDAELAIYENRFLLLATETMPRIVGSGHR